MRIVKDATWRKLEDSRNHWRETAVVKESELDFALKDLKQAETFLAAARAALAAAVERAEREEARHESTLERLDRSYQSLEKMQQARSSGPTYSMERLAALGKLKEDEDEPAGPSAEAIARAKDWNDGFLRQVDKAWGNGMSFEEASQMPGFTLLADFTQVDEDAEETNDHDS